MAVIGYQSEAPLLHCTYHRIIIDITIPSSHSIVRETDIHALLNRHEHQRTADPCLARLQKKGVLLSLSRTLRLVGGVANPLSPADRGCAHAAEARNWPDSAARETLSASAAVA